MGSWHVERLTSLHPDGVATDVQVRFREPDGEVAVVLPARSARGLGEGLCEAADLIEPKDEGWNLDWLPPVGVGWSAASVYFYAFEGNWPMLGVSAVIGVLWLWIWRRREDR